MRSRAGLVATVVAVAGCLALAGCGGVRSRSAKPDPTGAASAAPGAGTCLTLTDPGAAAPTASAGAGSHSAGAGPPSAGVGPPSAGADSSSVGAGSPSGGPATGAGEPLPDLTLPCFAGGQPVRLAAVRGPAVLNLWASWCEPCRFELPEIARYAKRAAGRVQVVGVITNDPNRTAAQSVVDDFGLRFPMVYDERAQVRKAVGALGIPTTLLVDAQGRVAYRYTGVQLDEAALARLVERYLGVRV